MFIVGITLKLCVFVVSVGVVEQKKWQNWKKVTFYAFINSVFLYLCVGVTLLLISSEQHHVKFNEDKDTIAKNSISIQKLSQGKLQVHLGFLKLHHTYEITIPLENPNHTHNINWIANVTHSFLLYFLHKILLDYTLLFLFNL